MAESFDTLAEFIDRERVVIVDEWERFARSLTPASTTMNALALRDHADEILTAIVLDMNTSQSAAEQSEKSQGRGDAHRLTGIGRIHAELRLADGFKLGQLLAEYRALRASVLRLWEDRGTDGPGVTRFNECIDEALTEAVESFTQTADRYRDLSLGILGHDLRNPLSAIITGSNLLLQSAPPADRDGRIAKRMLSSAQRMNRMIGDLLDLTRTRFGGQIPIKRADFDLKPLCEQVVAELEGIMPGRICLEAHGDLRGSWDHDRLAQVLSNLLRNAIQHGTIGDAVHLTARGESDAVTISIHNDGDEIPPSALNTMFEPMVRHVSDGASNEGLGLGLYIASRVVAAHAGTLDATSSADAGTTFTVRLPR